MMMKINNKINGVVFSKKDTNRNNCELLSKYDKRINDLLHTIEFMDATPNEAYKLYMK